jgi:hypothetical protein
MRAMILQIALMIVLTGMLACPLLVIAVTGRL